MSGPAATLAEYTDHELAEWYGASTNEEWQAILCAEMARRDQADAAERDAQAVVKPRHARRDDPVRDEWERAAYSQYLQAERELNGELVAPGAPVASGWDLWSGPERRALQYATEELRNFWLANKRITVTTWREQSRGDRREWNDQLDRDETSAIRPGASQGQSPGGSADSRRHDVPGLAARGAAQAGEVARATARPGRDVRGPDRGGMTVGAGGFIARAAVRDLDRAALRESIRARASQSRSGAPREPVAAERDPARVSASPTHYGASDSAVALREPGKMLTGRPAIDGAETLGYLYRFLKHFAVWGSEAELVASVLWIAQAHAKDADGLPAWQYASRLLVTGPYGSGKSWKARLIGKLAPAGEMLLEPTKPALIDLIADKHTVIITEADELFYSTGRNRGLLAVVNAGYEPDHVHTRKQGGKPVRIPLYGPVVLDGLDTLIKATRPDLRTLISRCIILHARKAPEGYRPPRFDGQARAVAGQLSQRTGAWMAQEVLDGIGDVIPDLPESLGNRPAALWEPLFTVALRADQGDPDGPWSQACADACAQLESAAGIPDATGDDMTELDRLMAGYGDDGEGWEGE